MRRDPATGRKVRSPRWGRGLRWQARHIRPDGTAATKAFATRDQAKLWLAKVQTIPELVAPRVTFTAVVDAWLTNQLHYRPSTREATKRRLDHMVKPAFIGLTLDQVTRPRVQEAVTGWAKDYAPATVRVAYSHLTSILRSAHADGLLESLPAPVRLPRGVRVPVVPLTVAQVATMREAMPLCLRSLVVVAAASGLRPSELAGLAWSRIDGQTITVDRQLVGVEGKLPVYGPPKSKAGNRRLGIGGAATEALAAHRDAYGVGVDGLVWRAPRGGLLTRKVMAELWAGRRGLIGGEPGQGWHQLRHFHASMLIAEGLSPVAVAARLGHADVAETLGTYAHLWPSDEARMEAVAQAAAVAVLGACVGPGGSGDGP